MTETEKQKLLDAAKILAELLESKGVETIRVPVMYGVLSFSVK
jgi:hypothetical protein